MTSVSVAVALRRTNKGQLKYDREWAPTKQALDAVTPQPCISSCWLDSLNEGIAGLRLSGYGPFENTSEVIDNSSSDDSEKLVKNDVKSKANRAYDQYVGVHIGMHTYAKEMEEKKRQVMEERKEKFRLASLKLSQQAEESLQATVKGKIVEYDEEYRVLKELEEKHDENYRSKHLVLQQAHQEQARRQNEVHVQLVSKEKERRDTAAKALKKVESLLEEITAIGTDVQDVLRNCKFPKFLNREFVSKIIAEFQTIFRVASEHVKKAKADQFQAPEFVKKMEDFVSALKSLLSTAKKHSADAEEKGLKEELEIKAKAAEAEKKRKEAEAAAAAQKANEIKAKVEKESELKAKEEAAKTMKETVSSSDVASMQQYGSFQKYMIYQTFLDETIKKCGALYTSKDKEHKNFLFSLKMAVKSPINAITDTSPAHLLDKIRSLSSLLSGQTVKVTGKVISTNAYPEAKFLSKELVAQSFVMQGVSQVSSSSDSAYCIAAVAVGVWSAHPEMGQLMLAYFYKMCPYLAPYYVPRMKDQSIEDYKRAQGYEVKDGNIEEDDKFLKRITGIIRLFAAMMSCVPPPGVTAHPFSIDNGWVLLTSILNLDPHVDTTATVLYNLLEVAGHALMACFKKQFQKLLFILCKEYIPKIEKVTPKQKLGPVSRLKIFLEKCISTGTIPTPKKYLTRQWWKS